MPKKNSHRNKANFVLSKQVSFQSGKNCTNQFELICTIFKKRITMYSYDLALMQFQQNKKLSFHDASQKLLWLSNYVL